MLGKKKEADEGKKKKGFWARISESSDGLVLSDGEIERMLAALVLDYHLNAGILAKLLGVSPEVITDYNKKKEELTGRKKTIFAYELTLLYSLTDTPADLRFQAYLQVLLDKESISPDAIAAFAGITREELDQFMADPESISYESRYRMGAVVMHLRFLFSRAELQKK